MVHGDLIDDVQALSLSEPEYLLFNPIGDKAGLRAKLDDVPRYLFRISTPKSDGTTDKFWVKSKDARHGRMNSREDVLELDDNQQVASLLNRHLRWWGKANDPDNFVSWTSSLLFALQYVFYRHTHEKDGSSLADIYLYIVDTAGFRKGTFVRDMDLILAYCSFDEKLQDLKCLRTEKRSRFSGSFYFGEYLSQGALKIEDKCQCVSAQVIIDQGLFHLQPEFSKSIVAEKPSWSNEVLRLREPFYHNSAKAQPVTKEELEAAIKIAQLFGPGWRLPMAANLIGLLPRLSEDPAILLAFTGSSFTGSTAPFLLLNKLIGKAEERQNCSPSITKIFAYATLPEVQQFDTIMRTVYQYTSLEKMKR